MSLKESLRGIFNRIKNAVLIDKKEIDEIIKDLQKALISSDVDTNLTISLCKEIRDLALREDLKSVDKRELLTKLVYEKLINLLGEKAYELKLEKGDRVLLIGLYGSGKTTTTIKLANYYAKKGFKTCVVGLDVHRPAAHEQLLQYAKNTSVKVFSDDKDPIKIWKNFEHQIKKFDIVFIDSAGRDALNEDLIKEIKEIYNEIKPTHVLLIIPADIGQAAKKQAEFFSKALNIDGIVLTRMDGTAKAGGALASCKQTNAKVFFIGVGEKVNDIERFDPKSYLQRILGLGDLESLIEKIKLSIEKPKPKQKEDFTLVDFYEQIKQMQNLGPLKKIMEFIPGISGLKIPTQLLDLQEQKIKRWGYAIDSMTKEERENPDIIDSSRLNRISKGSHVPVSEIKEMLKQYKLVKEFVGKGKGMAFDEKTLLKLKRRFIR